MNELLAQRALKPLFEKSLVFVSIHTTAQTPSHTHDQIFAKIMFRDRKGEPKLLAAVRARDVDKATKLLAKKSTREEI